MKFQNEIDRAHYVSGALERGACMVGDCGAHCPLYNWCGSGTVSFDAQSDCILIMASELIGESIKNVSVINPVIPIESVMPHKVSEVICVKCHKRWIAVRPENTKLSDLECANCGAGFVIETGEDVCQEE